MRPDRPAWPRVGRHASQRASVSVDRVDRRGAVATAYERDPATVGRPGGLLSASRQQLLRQQPLPARVGVHYVEIPIRLLKSRARVDELATVGCPDGIEVGTQIVCQPPQPTAVRADDVDLAVE